MPTQDRKLTADEMRVVAATMEKHGFPETADLARELADERETLAELARRWKHWGADAMWDESVLGHEACFYCGAKRVANGEATHDPDCPAPLLDRLTEAHDAE